MREYVIISHAYMSRGVCSSIQLIAGEQTKIDCICGYVDGNMDMDRVIRERIDSADKDCEVVIFTDLFGGSVNNAVLRVADGMENVHVIAGMNLALILGILLAPEDGDIADVIRETIEEAREGIVYCNDLRGGSDELDEF